MAKDFDRYYIEVKKKYKQSLISHRKDFMALLLRVLADDEEAEKELALKFGTKLVTKTSDGSTTKVFVDGEEEYRV